MFSFRHQHPVRCLFFFFNDTATTEIYPLSLHDALPISFRTFITSERTSDNGRAVSSATRRRSSNSGRSEEHTSELQSPCNLVCRLLLEKKKRKALTRLLRAAVAPSH